MGRRGRKKFFSIIFVPDQEQEPISFSMSYLKGKWILFFIGLLLIHIILGGLAYYKIAQLEKTKQLLAFSNADLTARNKRIERLMKEFETIRETDAKIRKAFGSSLGLPEQDNKTLLSEISLKGGVDAPQTQMPHYESKPVTQSEPQRQNGLYFLMESEGDYLDPDYIPNLLPIEGFLTTHFQKGGWYVGRSHYGIDIAAPKGSPIKAAGKGVVLMANWTPDLGNIVVLSHGKGLFSYYAHAMHLLVRQGFKVEKGQTIALLGSSGISSAPHLHFEIWKNGEALNPEDFIYALPRQEPTGGS